MDWIKEFEKECTFKPISRKPAEYATVFIHNGYSKYGTRWWYSVIEGHELFCLVKRNSHNEITAFYPCRLTNTKIFIGREIPAEDCTII